MIPLTILTPIANTRAPQNSQSLERLHTCGKFDVALVEAFGYSEVARARNQVASLAYDPVKERGGLVLWLDADMVVDPATVFLQAQLVTHFQKPISGRYVKRQDPSQLAAARYEFETRHAFEEKVQLTEPAMEVHVWMEPALVGMGALMLPAETFLRQADLAPRCRRTERGEPFLERIVCCPRVVEHPKHGHVMMSEDFDYCQRIEGAWLVEVSTLEGETSAGSWLDYGHMGTQVLTHTPQRHSLRDDRKA